MKDKKRRRGMAPKSGPLTRNAAGVAVAVHGDDRGTPEYGAQLARVSVTDTFVDDNNGAIRGRAVQVSDCLDRMLANATITQAMVDAGRRYQADFHRAMLDPLRAAPFEAQIKGQRDDTRALAARERIWRVIRAMGGFGAPASNALWFVLGAGYSIEAWARRERFGKGGSLNKHCARGILIGALSALRAHYDERA